VLARCGAGRRNTIVRISTFADVPSFCLAFPAHARSGGGRSPGEGSSRKDDLARRPNLQVEQREHARHRRGAARPYDGKPTARSGKTAATYRNSPLRSAHGDQRVGNHHVLHAGANGDQPGGIHVRRAGEWPTSHLLILPFRRSFEQMLDEHASRAAASSTWAQAVESASWHSSIVRFGLSRPEAWPPNVDVAGRISARSGLRLFKTKARRTGARRDARAAAIPK